MRLHRLLVAFVSLATLCCAAAEVARTDPPAAPPLPAELQNLVPGMITRTKTRRTHIVAVVERVKDAVVNIHSERTVQANNEYLTNNAAQNRINGMGTGIVIDPSGLIVTNNHVVEDVSVIRAVLSDGSTRSAAVIARNPERDLALLKISITQPLPVMPIGTAADLMVGETVIAIGNAYGYEHTVSEGVVSAIKRDVRLNKEMAYRSLIQTDASINPGNSGGPLLNVDGQLVGVNVAIRAGAQGIGFAIPADQMVEVASAMLRARRKHQNFDGITYHDQLNMTDDGPVRSVVVHHVAPNSPAERASLQVGDVLLKMGDVLVTNGIDVERSFLNKQPGDVVPVVFRRGASNQRVALTLSAPGNSRTRDDGPLEIVWEKLGLHLTVVQAEKVTQVNNQLHGGLEVVAVHADSAAAKAGIRRGDILVGLHQWETLTLDNVVFVLAHPNLSTFTPLNFYIVRDGQVRKGALDNIR
jgi:serine protease Do